MSAGLLDLLGVEMRRALHRRIVWWMVLLALVGCAVLGLIAFTTSSDAASLARDDHPALMHTWWQPETSEGNVLIAVFFLPLGAAICAASVAGAEWRAGTVATVLTWAPSRWRLQLARTTSAAVLTFVISVALQVVLLAALLPAVFSHGSTDGVDGQFWRDLALVMVRISFATTLVAIIAVSIATIGRNTSAALIAISAWALIGERLIAAYKPGLARFLISENVATMVPWSSLEDAQFQRGPLLALLTLAGYVGAIALAATVVFTRRDLSST